jgi:aryl-alcohol dehydrogenase-like predicted oxidoreductase
MLLTFCDNYGSKKERKMRELYRVMIAVAKRHDITVPQVAEAFCASKGIVPICGCRKPEQVRQLAEAVNVRLSQGEIRRLEEDAVNCNAKVLGHDMFRVFVPKKR